MTTKHYIKITLHKTIITFIVIALYVFLFFIMIGCSSVSYKTIPNAMCEDAQDYPTKYNMIDSPDGSKNPNAQINFLQLKH